MTLEVSPYIPLFYGIVFVFHDIYMYIRRMYTKECIYLENYSVYIIGMSSYYLYFMKVIQCSYIMLV